MTNPKQYAESRSTKKPQSTPTPWTYDRILGGYGQIVADGCSPIAEDVADEDGALIVKAVNEREGLLGALRDAHSLIGAIDNIPAALEEEFAEVWGELDAILAKAAE